MNTADQQNHAPASEWPATFSGPKTRDTGGQLSETEVSEMFEESLEEVQVERKDPPGFVNVKTGVDPHTTDGYFRKNSWIVIGITVAFAFLAGNRVRRWAHSRNN